MKTRHARFVISGFVLAALWVAQPATLVAQSDDEVLAAARGALKAERKAAIEEGMQLSAEEAKAFWPVYDKYRAEMDKVGEKIQKLVVAYASAYPEVTTDNARNGLKEMLALEKQQAAVRATHLAKIGKVLPPVKALRLAQLDMRLDLGTRMKLAAAVPLVPIEGKIGLKTTTDTYTSGSEPGMVAVTTIELSAKVLSIDRADRSVTLLGKDGIKETITVGEDVVNFDQVKVGDEVLMLLSDSIVVQMGDAVAGDRPESAVKLAPVGAKPGGVVANTIEIHATIVAMDPVKRTATLRSEDGMEKTYPVRADVDMSRFKIGDSILVRKTEAVALRISSR